MKVDVQETMVNQDSQDQKEAEACQVSQERRDLKENQALEEVQDSQVCLINVFWSAQELILVVPAFYLRS